MFGISREKRAARDKTMETCRREWHASVLVHGPFPEKLLALSLQHNLPRSRELDRQKNTESKTRIVRLAEPKQRENRIRCIVLCDAVYDDLVIFALLRCQRAVNHELTLVRDYTLLLY
jgi:hypothetical protein